MIDRKYKNIEDKLELLKHSILIRDIIEENNETKQITYKYKEYDENGNITKQGKTNCKINSIEEAVNLFNALGYEKLININDHLLIYANEYDELECVNNKHIYIEIEEKCNYINRCYKNEEEMKQVIDKYNFPLKQNNYYAKKAVDELNDLQKENLLRKKIVRWKFCSDNEKLIKLVLNNEKKATTSLYSEYMKNGKKLPKIGEKSIIQHDNNNDACLIEIEKVIITEFKNITDDLASIEGEGDKTLEYYKNEHFKIFKKLDSNFNDESKVVFEIFKVIEKYN